MVKDKPIDIRQLLEEEEDVRADGYVLYLRRSKKQKKKREGDEEEEEDEPLEKIDRISIKQQEVACEEIARKRGLNIVKMFSEEHSAKIPHKRRQFLDMLDYLRAHKGLGLLAWAPDRLSRNALEAGQLIQMFLDHHIIDFQFATYHFRHDSSGLEYLMMEFARAMGYSFRLRSAVVRGMRQKYFLSHEWPFGNKFGYTRLLQTRANGTRETVNFLIPHEGKDGIMGEFWAIQKAFELRLLGYSYQRIADEINAIGFMTKSGKKGKLTKSKLAGDGKKGKIGYLKDSIYYGIGKVSWGESDMRLGTEFDDEGNELQFVPAVSEKDFFLCQQVNIREAKPLARTRDELPFRLLIRCGNCGRKLSPAGKKDDAYFYCSNAECTGTRAHAQSKRRRTKNGITGSELFPIVGRIFQQKFQPSREDMTAYLLYIEKRNKWTRGIRVRDMKSLQAQKGHIQRKIDDADSGLMEALRNINNKETRDRLIRLQEAEVRACKQRLSNLLQKEKKLLEDERPWTQEFQTWLELMKNLHQHWKNATFDQMKRIAEEIFLELTVKDGKLVSYTCKDEYKALEKANLYQDGGAEGT